MNKIVSTFSYFAAFLSLFSCAVKPPLTDARIVELDDVQGLFGGQTLVIDTDGNVFACKVIPKRTGLKEQRYHFKLSSDELRTLLAFTTSSGISDYREHERHGLPDEARPQITLALPDHNKVVAAKWVGDKDPHFDKLYDRLLQLVERAAKKLPYRKQPYNPRFFE